MEMPLLMLGPKGLIKKHELVRVMVQCLYSLGYRRSGACLESESGITCDSVEFSLLRTQIMSANWKACIDTLCGLKELSDETRSMALFLVCRQNLLEYLADGDDSSALSVLRNEISTLHISREKVHDLAFSVISPREIGLDRVDYDFIYDKRKTLVTELEKVLPPPITIPERRLEYLVETAVSGQMDLCLYHNSLKPITLYEDHKCGRDQIPTETIQILTDHKDEVWYVQFSNNGEYLASSSSDCTAIIWKVQEDGVLTIKDTLWSHQKPVSSVSWSPDDTKLLTCGNREVVKLWDVETGKLKHTFGDHSFIISSCAWFPDSKKLVCGSSDPENGIFVYDCEGNEIKAWRGSRMPKVMDLAVTPDGENLVSILAEHDIRILNLSTNVDRVISEENPITSLSISLDSKCLIVNLNSQEIHMWDVEGKWGRPLKYKGHKQHKYVIRSCFGGFNSTFIASGSENSQVYIWNRRSPIPIEVLSGHSKTVNCVSWNPKRPQMLASASDDETIRIWGPSCSKKSA